MTGNYDGWLMLDTIGFAKARAVPEHGKGAFIDFSVRYGRIFSIMAVFTDHLVTFTDHLVTFQKIWPLAVHYGSFQIQSPR